MSKRLAALALLFTLWGQPAWAQFVFGAQATGSGISVASYTVALTTSAGDLLVCTTRERDGAARPTLSDNLNGAWTAGPTIAGAGTNRAAIDYFISSAAGSATITVQFGGNVVANSNCQRYTATGTVTADTSATRGTAAGTTHSSGSVTTTTGSVLLVANHTFDGDQGTLSAAPTNYTALTDSGRQWGFYRIGTGVITDTGTSTSSLSTDSVGVHAVFAAAAGGGGVCSGGVMLMGAGKC